MEWENIFANTSDKGLMSKIYKEINIYLIEVTLIYNIT